MNTNQQCTLGAMDANYTVSRNIGSRSRELGIPLYVALVRAQRELLPPVLCPLVEKKTSTY